MSEELSRQSKLSSRHTALGSGLEDWNGMGTAWSYNTDANDEHNAIRENVGMFDMSPLKKVHIRGADSASVVDHLITRKMEKIYTGKSAYGAILNEDGGVCDDAIIANNGDEYLLVHGTGESMEMLQDSASGKNVDIEFDDDMHDISVQGPKAVELLNAHTPIDLPSLEYFHQQRTELFGHPCTISRTGYTGERGYEIFVGADSVCDVWDNLVGEGVTPCSFDALDKVRVEAALLFFGYDMTAEHSPWEVGVGWSVCRTKGDFRGKEAVFAREGNERFVMAGLVADLGEGLVGGETLSVDGQNVGVVNSPVWSERMQKSLALVHIEKAFSKPGVKVLVSGEDMECAGEISAVPFYDPSKSNTHA